MAGCSQPWWFVLPGFRDLIAVSQEVEERICEINREKCKISDRINWIDRIRGNIPILFIL